jgi:hypothetical protein
MNKCSLCPSTEYLINLTPNSFDVDEKQLYYCTSCLNLYIRLQFGKHYIEVLKQIQELDDMKYQINQKRYSLNNLIEDSLDGKDLNEPRV